MPAIQSLGLLPSDHIQALRYLSLLYGDPGRFDELMTSLSRWLQIRTLAILGVHALPHVIWMSLAGSALCHWLSDSPYKPVAILVGIAIGAIFGVAVGAFFSVADALAAGILVGLMLGTEGGFAAGLLFDSVAAVFSTPILLLFAVAITVPTSVLAFLIVALVRARFRRVKHGFASAGAAALRVALSTQFGFVVCYWFLQCVVGYYKTAVALMSLGAILGVIAGLIYSIAGRKVDDRLKAALSATAAFAPAPFFSLLVLNQSSDFYPRLSLFGVSFVVSFVSGAFRLYYQPAHFVFVWPVTHGAWLRWHPVSWDRICRTGFMNLNQLLVEYWEANSARATGVIEALLRGSKNQRRSALIAKSVIAARQASHILDLQQIAEPFAALPRPVRLGSIAVNLFALATDIAEAEHVLKSAARPVFLETAFDRLAKTLDQFENEARRLGSPVSPELRAAVGQWRILADRKAASIKTQRLKEPVFQLFRANGPVDRERDGYVLRRSVLAELERRLPALERGGILCLSGPRKIGASSFLLNLPSRLGNGCSVLTLRSSEIAGSARRIADRSTAEDHLLIAINTVPIVSTEFEDLLGGLAAEHPHAIWLLDHRLRIATCEPLPLHPLTFDETHELLTDPGGQCSLWERDEQHPRLSPEFWGYHSIERIHEESSGLPYFVQLIAAAVIDIVNEENSNSSNPEILDAALSRSIVDGQEVLASMFHGESQSQAEWEYLFAFRGHEFQQAPEDHKMRDALLSRGVTTETSSGFRLRAPLAARWLRERGWYHD
jgi:hypothetical protein